MIQALPRIAGTIPGLSPTVAAATIRPSKVVPNAEAAVIQSPTAIDPRACSAASRALNPVPQADRSSRPGEITTAFRVTSPTPFQGAAIWTMLTPVISGFSG